MASKEGEKGTWERDSFLYSHLPAASSAELCATGCDVHCSLQDDRFSYGLHLTFHELQLKLMRFKCHCRKLIRQNGLQNLLLPKLLFCHDTLRSSLGII